MRSVVVTGAGRGIGRSIAARLAQSGWFVVGVERDQDTVDDLDSLLGDGGMAVRGDVAQGTVLDAAVAVAAEHASLGALVNNAAVNTPTNLHALDAEAIRRVIEVNLMGYVWGSAAAVNQFLAQASGGSIVAVSSLHARAAYPGSVAYDIAKAGVEALMRYIAVEYGAVGVRANSVSPAAVLTQMSEERINSTPDPAATIKAISERIPLRRFASLDEIAAVVEFLASDRSSYVTGQTIGVDGGMSATSVHFRRNPQVEALWKAAARNRGAGG